MIESHSFAERHAIHSSYQIIMPATGRAENAPGVASCFIFTHGSFLSDAFASGLEFVTNLVIMSQH